MKNIFGIIFTAIVIAGMIFLFKEHCQIEEPTELTRTESPRTNEWFRMIVTAYCPCEICCGPYADGFTASGVAAKGRICAAPPEYPFGTVFELEQRENGFKIEGYGEWIVLDRGGAIKGDKLDLLMPSHDEAKEWGVQVLYVRVKN